MRHNPCLYSSYVDAMSLFPSALIATGPVTSVSSTSSILSTRCRLPDRTLWFGRAHLCKAGISIRGWTLSGRYERQIPLDRIDEVEWRVGGDRANFFLRLVDGQTVPLQLVHGAGMWNVKLRELLGESVLAHPPLPEVRTREEIEQ